MRSMPESIATDASPSSVSCDAIVIGAFSSDNGLELVDGGLSSELDGYLDGLMNTGFRGQLGETVLVPSLGKVAAAAFIVTGLGPRNSFHRGALCSAAASAAKKASHMSEVASLLHLAIEGVEGSSAAVEGYSLGSYRFTRYKSDPKPSKLQRVLHVDADDEGLELGRVSSDATWLARDLINEPASTLTPEAFARAAREVADVNGLGCEILERRRLEELGFGGLLAVAQGSEQPPCLIHLTYRPAGATSTVALVGKGVTFDSGGLSIKPAASMELMKTDMAGGGVVLGVMSVLKRLGIKEAVEGFIPATENMTGGGAMRPGDVIRHYGGRTTEVTNTDAEGRLILADTLAYASERSPSAIVDVATLTGSMTVAIGKKASGLFCNDDALRDALLDASEKSGERTWPFPLYEDYLSELDSDVADAKNSGIRWGGAIIAAMFLKQFVGQGIPWAHLDIAGTGRSERDYLEISRGGTGIPVRSLLRWLRSR